MTDLEICMGTGDVPTPLFEVNQQSHTNLYSQKEIEEKIANGYIYKIQMVVGMTQLTI